MLIKGRQGIDRFLAKIDPGLRAAVIHGDDLGVVRERAEVWSRARSPSDRTIPSTSPCSPTPI